MEKEYKRSGKNRYWKVYGVHFSGKTRTTLPYLYKNKREAQTYANKLTRQSRRDFIDIRRLDHTVYYIDLVEV